MLLYLEMIVKARRGEKERTDGRLSREMVHAIVSVVRRGCAWRMLPHDVPPWLTVYPSVRRWRKDATRARRTDTLRTEVRRASGREAEPRATMLDSQSVKTMESGALPSSGGQCCNGVGRSGV
ncbi:transposase [Roseiflexus sp.]|uniref:transposase n=1 Tax=Roseiflexus sp. TaxID=2562120 RepID=UPI0025D85373|nr:transposase [Roseiflexus sp.]